MNQAGALLDIRPCVPLILVQLFQIKSVQDVKNTCSTPTVFIAVLVLSSVAFKCQYHTYLQLQGPVTALQ